MKITVIGTLNKDLILTFRGTPIESYGGIFYNMSVLSYLASDSDQIFPVSYIGEDISVPLNAVLHEFPNVSTDGLILTKQKNHRVILEYISPYNRTEKAVFNFRALSWKQVSKFLESDMVIVNLISGWDINKDTFLKISAKVRKKLYLDVHFLVMGIDKLGKRFPKRPDDIHAWLRGARFVQMNKKEFEIISENNLSEIDFFKEYFISDQVLIITRGKNGAKLIHKEHREVKVLESPAQNITTVVDTTGCGDAFGSAFVFNYLTSKSLEKAVNFANCVAGATSVLRGTNEMHRLKEVMNGYQCGDV
jgi:adenosine kinase